MVISKEILSKTEQILGAKVISCLPVSGGSINQTYRLQTSKRDYFIKINNGKEFPGMFEAEAAGLKLISDTGAIAVPMVIATCEAGDESFLLMEWVDTRRPTAKASEQLGRALAEMHRHSAAFFGLDGDNYMGSLRQSNRQHQTWTEFFINERLQPMAKMAVDAGWLNRVDLGHFEALYSVLPGLFDEEPPALIHGDLWGGNYLIGEDETPYLIDPAVSFGHREFDIAMTTLFGGFSREFYAAYHEAFPLAPGWDDRTDLWNLYPLLVHLNLFGGGYLGQVRDALQRYLNP